MIMKNSKRRTILNYCSFFMQVNGIKRLDYLYKKKKALSSTSAELRERTLI